MTKEFLTELLNKYYANWKSKIHDIIVIDENTMAAILKPLFSLINVLLVSEDMKESGITK